MAATTEQRTAFNTRLLFRTKRLAVFEALANPTWYADLLNGINTIRTSQIKSTNVAVRDLTEDEVAAASNFTPATLEGFEDTRNLFEGTASTRMLETYEVAPGMALINDVQRDLSQELALHMDSKAAGLVTADANYGAGADKGLTLPKVGATGANGIGISIAYEGIVGRGTSNNAEARAAFIGQIADLFLRAQEYWQDMNLRGFILGSGAPVRFAAVTLPGVAAAIKRSEAAQANGFRQASDVGAELLTTLNLMGGMRAFEGMLHDTAIYTVSPSADRLPKPAAADGDWPIYFLPVGSALAFESELWRTDRIPGPLEDGSYVDRWISVGRYMGRVMKPQHLVRATINASAKSALEDAVGSDGSDGSDGKS